MDPPCAKCNKTVYPTEKITCLDKDWHQACFRCETCNVVLNLRTYRGYNNHPYCCTHVPKTALSPVAETPESRRLARSSTQQSEIDMLDRFDKERGHFTQVEDDEETMRVMKNRMEVSNFDYHGPDEGRSYPMRVGDDPETMRAMKMMQVSDIPDQVPNPGHPAPAPPSTTSGKRYRAVFDYTSANDDQVSFMEGDEIVDVEEIDDGWMSGLVTRTGHVGLLPANFVEPI